MVFAIFAITGWDAAAPLAEESQDPKRTVPRAVMGSILIMGVFLVLVSWGQTSGWGTDLLTSGGTKSFAGAPQLPAFILGQRYWGGAWWIVLFALFNSAIAVSIACTNASTRFLYGMARAKALPSWLLKIDAKRQTPVNAVILQTGINVLLGLILPIFIGVANVYNVTGTWFTFALAFVYIVANVGLYVFYKREHPEDFSGSSTWWSRRSAPSRCWSWSTTRSIPLPAWPVGIAPFIVLGWLAIGVIVVFTVYRGQPGQ